MPMRPSDPRELRRPALAALFLLAAACAGAGEDAVPAVELPPGVSPVPEAAHLSVPPSDDPDCQPRSMRDVFRERSAWDGYWEFGLKEGCPRPALPEGFDFSREMVAMVSMGLRQNPGDRIRILGSGVVGDSVVVVVDRTMHDRDCPGQARVPTWPRDLVRIPADARPVRFLERRQRVPCPEPGGEP